MGRGEIPTLQAFLKWLQEQMAFNIYTECKKSSTSKWTGIGMAIPGSSGSCGTWTPACDGWLQLGTDRGAVGRTQIPRRSISATSSSPH